MLLAPIEDPRPLLTTNRRAPLRHRVQEALRYMQPPVTSVTLARRLGQPVTHVWGELDRLVQHGLLLRIGGEYVPVERVIG